VKPTLIIFGGLPATGKTRIARELARHLGVVHLRIDSIEQAIRNCEPSPVDSPLGKAGYVVAYAVAEDNLQIGRTVIADSVNPVSVTREAWMEVAKRAGVRGIEVETLCSDTDEHRRRVETRRTDKPGLKLPSWLDVLSREYHAWPRDHIVIDTAGFSAEESVSKLRKWLAAYESGL
jgi:predicted kinase